MSTTPDGIARGGFTASDPVAVAQAVFDATTAFHHPAHADEWQAESMDAALHSVCDLIIDGLRTR